MNPTALLVLLLAGLILFLGVSGRLDNVWKAATSGGTGTQTGNNQASKGSSWS